MIVKGDKNNHPTVIDLPSLLELNLIRRIESIVELNERKILKDYRDVFEGIGIIKDFEYDIKLKEEAKGSIAACRKVPIALLEPLKAELNKIEKFGIIEKVTEPSDWVNLLVITQKKMVTLGYA